MYRCRHLTLILAAAALLLLVAAPASSQVITAGTDLWETADGTFADFTNTPIPAGFFCPGSPPIAELIEFAGVPVLTNPTGIAANTDTVIERLQDLRTAVGSTTQIVVRAMSLVGKEFLYVTCGDGSERIFEVHACTCGEQPITELVVDSFDPACGCGTVSGELLINVCITFTDVDDPSQVYGPLSRPVFLTIDRMDFCIEGSGELETPDAFQVGVDCPGLGCDDQMIAVSGTSNFYPGRSCSTSGVDCLTLYGHLTRCHSSGGKPHEHCVNPMCCGSEGVPCPQ